MSGTTHSSSEIIQLTAFKVGNEEYVVDILRVREILRPLPITPVRRGPRFVEGVINLRGAVIPVVDMRRRFDLPVVETPTMKIIILSIDRRTIGLVVDQVTEVVRVPKSAIRPAPGLLDDGKAPYFLGVCHHQGRILILLNVRTIITSEEAVTLPDTEALLRGPA